MIYCIYSNIYMYIYEYTYIHAYIYRQMCIYIFICVHICMYFMWWFVCCSSVRLFLTPPVPRLVGKLTQLTLCFFFSIWKRVYVCVSSNELCHQLLRPSLYLQPLPHDSHVSLLLGRVQEVSHRTLMRHPTYILFSMCYPRNTNLIN